MSVTWMIIIAFLVVLIALITFNYYRLKNAKPVAPSEKVRILGNRNYKLILRKGVVLVDFWAPWCGPCKVVAPVINDIAESEERIIVGKVNVDQNQPLAQKYKIRNIPTMILFKDGKEIHRFVGVKTKKAIMKEVHAALS